MSIFLSLVPSIAPAIDQWKMVEWMSEWTKKKKNCNSADTKGRLAFKPCGELVELYLNILG